jgi:hypothetical protein
MEKEAADLPGIWRAAALNSSDGNGKMGNKRILFCFQFSEGKFGFVAPKEP